MKNHFVSLALALVLAVSATAESQARDTKTKTSARTTETTEIHTSQAAAEAYGGRTWGLGVSTIDIERSGVGSITAIFDVAAKSAIQVFLGIPTTQGTFHFSLGGMFKYTVAEAQNAGLHVGGALFFGNQAPVARTATSNSAFAISFGGVGGIHFAVPGSTQVQFHVDAGPVISIVDGDSAFGLGAYSAFIGGSLVYMF
jgi:hypothetical protein